MLGAWDASYERDVSDCGSNKLKIGDLSSDNFPPPPWWKGCSGHRTSESRGSELPLRSVSGSAWPKDVLRGGARW